MGLALPHLERDNMSIDKIDNTYLINSVDVSTWTEKCHLNIPSPDVCIPEQEQITIPGVYNSLELSLSDESLTMPDYITNSIRSILHNPEGKTHIIVRNDKSTFDIHGVLSNYQIMPRFKKTIKLSGHRNAFGDALYITMIQTYYDYIITFRVSMCIRQLNDSRK